MYNDQWRIQDPVKQIELFPNIKLFSIYDNWLDSEYLSDDFITPFPFRIHAFHFQILLIFINIPLIFKSIWQEVNTSECKNLKMYITLCWKCTQLYVYNMLQYEISIKSYCIKSSSILIFPILKPLQLGLLLVSKPCNPFWIYLYNLVIQHWFCNFTVSYFRNVARIYFKCFFLVKRENF